MCIRDRIKNGLSDIYSKDFEYHLNDEKSFPLSFNQHIRGPVTRHRSFAAANTGGDPPDFPYWNLLRQKWLISAQPRRLSQVRLFRKWGIDTNERKNGQLFMKMMKTNLMKTKKDPYFIFSNCWDRINILGVSDICILLTKTFHIVDITWTTFHVSVIKCFLRF